MRGWLAAEKLPNWHHFFIRDSGQKINKAPDGISSHEYLQAINPGYSIIFIFNDCYSFIYS